MSCENGFCRLEKEVAALGNTDAYKRLELLFDNGIYTELDRFQKNGESGCGVVTAFGTVNGIGCYAYSQDITVLSGGLPRGVDDNFYGRLARAVDPRSLKIVDASGGRLFSAIAEGADLVKPNLDELEHTLGRRIESKEDMLAACRELLDRGAKRVLLSLGKQGAVITDGTHNYYCKSMNVAVNSTVGAGEGMVAAAALKLEEDAPLSEILRAGVAAGTATVMTVGKVSFTKEKYNEVLGNLHVTEI